MAAREIRGLESHEEIKQKRLIRDTRTIPEKVSSVLKKQNAFISIMAMLIASSIMAPLSTYPCFFLSIAIISHRYFAFRRDRLPFRLPAAANRVDYSDPVPGRKKFFGAGGIFCLGNEYKTNQELWLKAKDVLTHMLLFGTTGSGKTETLVSLSYNALAMGSGFFYIDPKAAPKLEVQIYIMSRFCGRDDDFRVMNYSIAGKTSKQDHPKTLTNTNNPFAFGSAEGLTQLLVSLIPASDGNNAIFGQNAQTLITSAMYALVELRNKGEFELSIETIREHLTLEKMIDLVEREDLSEATISAMESFLSSVGWQKGTPLLKQPRSLAEQFGYARAYFGLSLASLTDTYGHIYKTTLGEVDMYDVIKNRRILVVMLPSLEKAPQELQNLGKVSLSAVRNAISIGLGDKNEGTISDVLESLPTDAPTPFLSITDEYAAIPTPGYAEVLTQGRGLGVAAIVASQDYAGIKGADETGAQQIIANTKIKLAMKQEDPQATWELFKALAGEANIMKTGGYHFDKNRNMQIDYTDQGVANADKVGRIHLQDLQEQIEGEFHAFFNGDVVRGQVFYANPPLLSKSQVRIVQMVPVPMPVLSELEAKLEKNKESVSLLTKFIQNGIPAAEEMEIDVQNLKEVFDKPNNLSKEDQAIAALLHWRHGINSHIGTLRNDLQRVEESLIPKKETFSEEPDTPRNLVLEKQAENSNTAKEPVKGQLTNHSPVQPNDEILFPQKALKPEPMTENTKKELSAATQKPGVEAELDDRDQAIGQMSQQFSQNFESLLANMFTGTDDSVDKFEQDVIQMEVAVGASPEEAQKRAKKGIETMVKNIGIDKYPEEEITKEDQSTGSIDYIGDMINRVQSLSSVNS